MEPISAGEIDYRLIRLPGYERDLKALRRLEPNLHGQVRKSLKTEIESGDLDEIQGTGGWVKGRAGSPSRNIGKSGGFRFIYLVLRVHTDIYLQAVYDHRSKADLTPDEKKALRSMSMAYKRAYGVQGGIP